MKLLRLSVALLCLLPVLAQADVRLTGYDGQSLTLAAPATRVVSLAPDMAELLFDIDAGQVLVGTVQYSDFPAGAKRVPRLGDAFHVDVEKLVALKPDLVLAWEGGTPQALIDRLRSLGLPVLALGTHDLTDVAANIETLGAATDHRDSAARVAGDFRAHLASLKERYAGAKPIRAFYEISAQPLFTVGGAQSISRLLQVCGAENIFADLSELAPAVSLEAVLGRDPQVIVTGDGEGDAAERFKDWQNYPKLAATQAGNFITVNDDWISRSTPRLLDAGDQLCASLAQARTKLAASASHP